MARRRDEDEVPKPNNDETEIAEPEQRVRAADLLAKVAVPAPWQAETLRYYVGENAKEFRAFLKKFPRRSRRDAWNKLLDVIEQELKFRPNSATVATYLSACKPTGKPDNEKRQETAGFTGSSTSSRPPRQKRKNRFEPND